MEFIFYEIRIRNGEAVRLREAADGRFICPICGLLAAGPPPYDPRTSRPSYQFCPGCENQFGWDDIISPEAPAGAQAVKWAELREQWVRTIATPELAAEQLRNLGLEKLPN